MLRFRAFGVGVSISLWFPLMFAAIVSVGAAKSAFGFMTAAAIHELGHMVMMLAVGERVDEIGFYLGRIEIKQKENSDITARKMMLIYLGGIVFNIISAIFAYSAGLTEFFSANIALAVFNMMPSNTFDGARCCELLMEMNRVPHDIAARRCKRVSYAVGCGFAAAGIACIALGISYLPSAAVLLYSAAKACFFIESNP